MMLQIAEPFQLSTQKVKLIHSLLFGEIFEACSNSSISFILKSITSIILSQLVSFESLNVVTTISISSKPMR